MSDLLFRRLRLAREGAAVERCHAHNHLQSYTVGSHTYGLVALLILCWQEDHDGELPSSALLTAATFHDTPERITGDIPSPMKHLLGDKVDGVEERVIEHLLRSNVFMQLTEEECAYLHAADQVELCLWAVEEARRGNREFLDWVGHYQEVFMTSPPPPAFVSIMENLRGPHSLTALSWTYLKGIAGL